MCILSVFVRKFSETVCTSGITTCATMNVVQPMFLFEVYEKLKREMRHDEARNTLVEI